MMILNVSATSVGGMGLCVLLSWCQIEQTSPDLINLYRQSTKAAYEAGAMIRVSGPNIILSPPLILTAEDVRTILEALRVGLSAV